VRGVIQSGGQDLEWSAAVCGCGCVFNARSAAVLGSSNIVTTNPAVAKRLECVRLHRRLPKAACD
jgi:hypothetical protein